MVRKICNGVDTYQKIFYFFSILHNNQFTPKINELRYALKFLLLRTSIHTRARTHARTHNSTTNVSIAPNTTNNNNKNNNKIHSIDSNIQNFSQLKCCKHICFLSKNQQIEYDVYTEKMTESDVKFGSKHTITRRSLSII